MERARIRIAASAEITPDFDSSVIMTATGKPYSHVLAIINVMGLDLIFHAGGDPVSFESLDRFLLTHKLVHDVEVECNRSLVDVFKYMVGRLGTPYSEAQLLGHAVPETFRSDLTMPINGDGETICSEEMALLLTEVTDGIRFNWNADHLRPEHIVDAVTRAASR